MKITYAMAIVATALSAPLVGAEAKKPVVEVNHKDDGYRGIWYYNQPSKDEYVYKYSGGLGTYCAHHQPFAVYSPQVQKTFFCYGGTTKDSFQHLLHEVSFYDHQTGTVPRPTIVVDKATEDAHDNPVIALDDRGYVWIFSTSHGRSRPSFIHRSKKPYDIEQFERVNALRMEAGKPVPLDNFSYFQAWYVPGRGFLCPFTRYSFPAARTSCFITSPDGVTWSDWQRLAAIQQGHYQVSAVGRTKVGAASNFHPEPQGLNWRTNLYYMESSDWGRTWQSANGETLSLPLTEVRNPALVHDWQSEGLKVYLMDMVYDADDRPVIVLITSKGYEPGPANGPRTWTVCRWTGTQWAIHPVTTSGNNYDMGSLYLEADGTWRLIGPTQTGPQPFNPGGEVAMWVSSDQGQTWKMTRQMTRNSPRNHTYVRRPVNAHSDFYALWADGHARQPSESRLYFCNRAGDVFALPVRMEADSAQPERVREWQR
jgi:hypothetical protein